jgi:hypothetical protein
MKSKALAVHVTSIILGAVGIITLLHPGFVLPAIVLTLVPIACAAFVTLLQITHDFATHQLQFNLASLEKAYEAVSKDVEKDVNVTTPALLVANDTTESKFHDIPDAKLAVPLSAVLTPDVGVNEKP